VLSPPPLRERREDLGLIVKALLEEAKVKEASITIEAARALLNGGMSGNVRELRNVLRRAAAGHAKVHIEQVVKTAEPKPKGAPSRGGVQTKGGAKVSKVERPRGWKPTRDELVSVLEQCGGSPAAAARALDTYPRQLYRWL